MAETNIKDVKLKIGTETQFQSKLKDLPINTLVGTTDPIQEGELDTAIITKLNKAENALPKPSNDTTGSAGQVLKKTSNGSEWGDAPSGGGKLFTHKITGISSDYANTITAYYISSDSAKINSIEKMMQLGSSLTHAYGTLTEDTGLITQEILYFSSYDPTANVGRELVAVTIKNGAESRHGLKIFDSDLLDTVTEL